MPSINQESPPQPEHDTRAFRIDQIIAGAVLAAGINIARDHLVVGSIVSAVGLGWLVYLRWEHKPMPPQIRTPNSLAVVVLLFATFLMGYDIYDRHYVGTEIPAPIAKFVTPGYHGKPPPKFEWHNEKVPLDGYDYEYCHFVNVTFVYNGTTPIQFNHNRISGYGFESENGALGMMAVFWKAMGELPHAKLILTPGMVTDVPHETMEDNGNSN